jgi:dTDP-D-glucose 4,6-dehydratase
MFIDRHKNSFEAAKVLLKLVKVEFPDIERVLDVGCGVGTFLKTANDMGMSFTQDSKVREGDQFITSGDSSLIAMELGWTPQINFDLGIKLQVEQFLNSQ